MSGGIRHYLKLLRADPSAWALVFANVFAVAACLWHGRPLATLILVYWVELGIIALLSIPKLILIGGFIMAAISPFYALVLSVWWAIGLPLVAVIHEIEGRGDDKLFSSQGWDAVAAPSLVFAISHVYSFFHNYVGRGEYRHARPEHVLAEAFERVVPTLIATIAGAALGLVAMQFGLGVLAVVPFFLGRLFVDLPAHWHGHGYMEGIEFPWLRWLQLRRRGLRQRA